MTIPEEAVDAAAEGICDAAFGQELPEAPIDLARAALTAALPLLLPTREQIAQAIFDSPTGEDWYACQEAADAVLALIGDPPCCAHPKCPGGSICCCQKEGD